MAGNLQIRHAKRIDLILPEATLLVMDEVFQTVV